MIRIPTILVPVDFSEPSKEAVNYGLSLALQFESRLILAHISKYDPAAYENAKAALLQLIPWDCRERLNFEIIVKSGDVRPELIGIVEEKDVSLVVMGTRGRSHVGRLLLGSVTERMLRKLNVPILTVSHLGPEKEIHKPAPVALQRILYATDLAEGHEEGLRLSMRLAHALDASLTVAHVIQFGEPSTYGIEIAGLPPDYGAQLHAQAEEKLSRAVGLVSDGSVPISTVVAEGTPYETINTLAERYKADLIVINLQGKRILERALLGTTAERVIRTATVPVLALPLAATYASRWIAA
jgi:nucleotide-binding universal stress UspA family protein